MRPTNFLGAAIAALSLTAASVTAANAGSAIIDLTARHRAAPQAIATTADSEGPVQFRERDLSGPRVGFTVSPVDDHAYHTLRDNGMGRMVSQFGWHFEHQLVPVGGGPQVFTQVVPLFGGVEYGKLIPTLTLAVGLRLPSGVEFGVGPSFTLVNAEGKSKSGLMLGVGRSIQYSGVSIPLNLAVSTNNEGTRVTLLAGYAIRRATR
jgi:hypothetical protein